MNYLNVSLSRVKAEIVLVNTSILNSSSDGMSFFYMYLCGCVYEKVSSTAIHDSNPFNGWANRSKFNSTQKILDNISKTL